jgi:hypothetical protein
VQGEPASGGVQGEPASGSSGGKAGRPGRQALGQPRRGGSAAAGAPKQVPKHAQRMLDRQLKEIRLLEGALTESRALVALANNAREFKTLTEGTLGAMLKRVDARMKPELLPVVTYEVSEGEEDEEWLGAEATGGQKYKDKGAGHS